MEHIFHETKEWELYDKTMPSGWYFWDETGAYCHGPFCTRDECRDNLKRYAEDLLK